MRKKWLTYRYQNKRRENHAKLSKGIATEKARLTDFLIKTKAAGHSLSYENTACTLCER